MARLYLAHPQLRGTANGATLVAAFEIERSNQGDLQPTLWMMDTGDESIFSTCGGNFRTCTIGGGGGGSPDIFDALSLLKEAMARDRLECGEFAADGIFELNIPHGIHPYMERHMDDACGYLGMDIREDGSVHLHARPHDPPYHPGQTPVDVIMAADTPFRHTYNAMPKLWLAIKTDNAKHGLRRGNYI